MESVPEAEAPPEPVRGALAAAGDWVRREVVEKYRQLKKEEKKVAEVFDGGYHHRPHPGRKGA